MAKQRNPSARGAKQPTAPEQELVRLIQEGISQAKAEGRVIDRDTARRIAAAVHRGLGGELERLAATGKLLHHHAARLELFYTLKDEPRFKAWGLALREFINWDARVKKEPANQHSVVCRSAVNGLSVAQTAKPLVAGRRSSPGPEAVLPQANLELGDCEHCSPEGVLVYVCNQPGDDVQRKGLALHMQHQTCRRFTGQQLRKRLEASFMDNAHSKHDGLKRLLAHVAICHNQRVVVQRLDRLPPNSPEAEQVIRSGARVLSASEQNPRSQRRQGRFGADLGALAQEKPGHGTRTRAKTNPVDQPAAPLTAKTNQPKGGHYDR